MAYADRELFVQDDAVPAKPRIYPREGGVVVGTLAAVGAAPTYLKMTPMAFNTATNLWVVWTSGGGNNTGVVGAILYEEITVDAADTVHAQLMTDGEFHIDDIAVPSGETLANLKTALKNPATRNQLLRVQGLPAVWPQ